MKVFFNTTFEGHWPVGTSAVVVAESREAACELLNAEIVSRGLAGGVKATDMIELGLHSPTAVILQDGNY